MTLTVELTSKELEALRYLTILLPRRSVEDVISASSVDPAMDALGHIYAAIIQREGD